jgi:hypothetical protein
LGAGDAVVAAGVVEGAIPLDLAAFSFCFANTAVSSLMCVWKNSS